MPHWTLSGSATSIIFYHIIESRSDATTESFLIIRLKANSFDLHDLYYRLLGKEKVKKAFFDVIYTSCILLSITTLSYTQILFT